MAGNSTLVSWTGGTRAGSSGSSKFIVKQADRLFGTVPKTEFAFGQWLIEEGYDEALDNNIISSNILYDQLRRAFFGNCQGGNGTLTFGIEVSRKDRVDLPTSSSYKIFPSWGYLHFRGTQSGVVKQLLIDVDNTDEIVVSDYYITGIERAPWVAVIVGGVTRYNGRPPGQWTEGGAFDSYGDRLTKTSDLVPSEETLDEYGTLTVKFPEKRVGTYKITIEYEFDDFVLIDPMRPSANDIYDEDEVYDSTIYTFGGGDYAKLEVDIPDEAADCIQYTTVTDEDGNIVTVLDPPDDYSVTITNIDGSTTVIDSSNVGPDGTADIEGDIGNCTCWQCGGTGVLPECEATATIDCTCTTCGGDGILPGCQEDGDDFESNTTTYIYNNYGGSGDGDGGDTDKPYTLKVKKHKCTNQVVDWELIKN